jgi:hypothetical protein
MSRILIALGLLSLLCGRAEAQSSPWQQEERTTAGWTFTPGAAVGGSWDSGIQVEGNSVAEALFKKWVGIANPYAEVDYNGRHSHVNFGYSGAFEKYWSNELLWEHRGKAGVHRILSPRVDVAANASYTAVPTTDRLQLVNGTVPFAQVNSHWLDAGGRVGWQTSPRIRVFGNYHFERIALDELPNSSDFFTLRDGYSHAPSLGFTRDFTPRLVIGATAEFRRDHVGVSEDFDIRTLTGEFTYRWNSATSVSGGGGASQLYTVALGEIASTSPTYHAGLEHRLRAFNVGAHYSYGFEQLYGIGTLAKTDTFSGNAYVPLADHLYYLNVTAAYTRNTPIRDVRIGLDMQTFWADATVGRQLARRLRAEAYISMAHQDAIGRESSSRVRVGIQIVTFKPLRIQ